MFGGFKHQSAGANQAICPTQPQVLYVYIKNLMYINLIKMIPDIRYDIRYDIMYDILLIQSVPGGSCSRSGDLECQMDGIVPWVCH